MKPMTMSPAFSAPIVTRRGVFMADFSAAGLFRLTFPTSGKKLKPPQHLTGAQESWLELTNSAVRNVLQGVSPHHLPPLDLALGTAFQQTVWGCLRAIPLGERRTYGQIALAAGSPKAARAAGQACGANPIPLLIPCHRVVAAHGQLGGFSGGLAWKRWLLERENPISTPRLPAA